MPDKIIPITVTDSKTALDTALSAKIADKAVRDFCCGLSASCAETVTVDGKPVTVKIAACTFGDNGGWITLADGSMYHEVDREVVKKYGLVDKPIYDSYYYHVFKDGTSKLLTHAENGDMIAKQESPKDMR